MTRRRLSAGREILRVLALGVQVYRLEPDGEGRLVPKPIGPRADLFDFMGRKLGALFMGGRGPVWAIGAGCVVGKEVHRRPSPNADSIPEIQLAATTSGADGALGGTRFVEQIDTFGGGAPAVVPALHAGDTVESPYSAEYVFYAAA